MDSSSEHSGYVFNIQKFSVHDGPGIRTIVFLKGCPLRCPWCSNPESQHTQPQLARRSNKCIGCGRCLAACPHKAISLGEQGKLLIDRKICHNCFKCASVCPSTAMQILGEKKSIAEILAEVEADGAFYARSDGGMTLSGGEPLFQAEFAVNLLKEAKRRRIHTAIETSGYVPWTVLENACRYLNTVLFDIKSLNPVKHMKFTGVSNEQILSNFERMCSKFSSLQVLVRTPVIPGFNDREEDILAIVDFIRQFPNVKYELLPYHRLGLPKYESLGLDYPLGDARLDSEIMSILKSIAKGSCKHT